ARPKEKAKLDFVFLFVSELNFSCIVRSFGSTDRLVPVGDGLGCWPSAIRAGFNAKKTPRKTPTHLVMFVLYFSTIAMVLRRVWENKRQLLYLKIVAAKLQNGWANVLIASPGTPTLKRIQIQSQQIPCLQEGLEAAI